MARRVVRASTGFRRARRPGGTWSRDIDASTTIPVSSKVLLASFVLSNPGIGETVRRTVGGIWVVTDQTAASEIQEGAFGMIVVSDLALAAGAASIPGPVTDASDDGWFVWQGFAQSVSFASATGVHQLGRWYPFDSRAMRRNEEGFGIAVMAENFRSDHVFLLSTVVSLYATRS